MWGGGADFGLPVTQCGCFPLVVGAPRLFPKPSGALHWQQAKPGLDDPAPPCGATQRINLFKRPRQGVLFPRE